MSTTYATRASNKHIEALEAAFDSSVDPIEWLVIAHNDSRLIDSLSSALAHESAAMLELSSDTWDFTEQTLRETIEWSLQQGTIRNIVLAGHSQAAGPTSRASLLAPVGTANSDAPPTNSYDRLVAGIKRTAAAHESARDRFKLQVQQLTEIASRNDVAVVGLFYLAESGVFLGYDGIEERFCPTAA